MFTNMSEVSDFNTGTIIECCSIGIDTNPQIIKNRMHNVGIREAKEGSFIIYDHHVVKSLIECKWCNYLKIEYIFNNYSWYDTIKVIIGSNIKDSPLFDASKLTMNINFYDSELDKKLKDSDRYPLKFVNDHKQKIDSETLTIWKTKVPNSIRESIFNYSYYENVVLNLERVRIK